MDLPNKHLAQVAREKIVDYLLSPTNSDGKEAVFRSFGFQRSGWMTLRDALILHGQNNPVTEEKPGEFGMSYLVEGPLNTPYGRQLPLRTVWMIDWGTEAPRLISAYPL